MLSKSWLYIIGLMFLGNIVTAWSGNLIVAILCDLAVLFGGYFIIRNDPFLDLRSNMIFLTALTVINILIAIGLISRVVGNEAFIALLVWSWFGIHHKYFRYFVLGAVIYNGVQIMNLYRAYGFIDWATAAVSATALVIVAYVDRRHF